VARFFADSDNKVAKGWAILGIYAYTAIFCKWDLFHLCILLTYFVDLGINSTTWLYGVEILPMSLRSRV